MKRIISTFAMVIAVGVFVTLVPPSKLIQAQTSEPKQPFETAMSGTYAVFSFANEIGIAIENPKIVHINERPFLVGMRSGKIAQFQETPFTGGLTFIQLKEIVSIQQLMAENE